MMQYILNPLKGVCWEDAGQEQWLCFGDSRERVVKLLGAPQDTGGSTYLYFQNQLQISFDKQDAVEFMDFLGGNGSSVQPVIYGVDVFNTDADAVIDAIKEQSNDWKEDCMEYLFFDRSIGLMRGGMPGSLDDFIAEMQEDGIDPESAFGREQIAFEEAQIRYCQCIGIGVKDYYEEFR